MIASAVIFDLDGTLVDTLPDLHAALASLLDEAGAEAPSPAAVRGMVGDGARKLVERALAWASLPADPEATDHGLARFLELYGADPCRRSRLFPGVEATLAALAAAGRALAVCTNKPQGPSEAILAGLGIAGYFSAVVGGDIVKRRKPHPDHLRAVLGRLGAEPERAVMVGDSINDLAAAHSLGMRCVLVRFGYGSEPVESLGADRLIDDFRELPPVLDELGAAMPSA